MRRRRKKTKPTPNRLSVRPLKEDGSVRRPPPKPGRVVRLDRTLASLLSEVAEPGETVSHTIKRLIENQGRKTQTFFVLPSSLHRTIEEARGAAVIERLRKKAVRTEKPVAVTREE